MAVTSATFAEEKDFQSLLLEIDEAIEQSPSIVARYEQQTEEIRQQYQRAG